VIVAVLGAMMVFAIGLVPVIGTIAALVIGGYFSARAAAYDCYDAVLSRRDLPYDQKAAYLAARRSRTLGLGATTAGLLLVPGVNLLALGVGAAGATLAVLDGDRSAAAR
jgi:CysZ protein